MFDQINSPKLVLGDDVLMRRSGLFYRKKIRLSQIQRVVAVLKDAVTHEEIMIGFFEASGREIWVSEFDREFGAVMSRLAVELPGFVVTTELAGPKPFDRTEKVLWRRDSVTDQ